MSTYSPRTKKSRHFQDASQDDTKRLRTRALILDTAIAVMAKKGIERTSVMEVAEQAGLSNGSFYYHFRNKTELVEAVAGAVAAALVREVDEAISGIEQGTQRVALATMLFIERGLQDPIWGRLIVHALSDLGEFREQIFAGIRKDVGIGIRQGYFKTVDSPALYAMLLAIVSASMREALVKRDDSIPAMAAQAILRVLGIDIVAAETVVTNAKQTLRKGHVWSRRPQ